MNILVVLVLVATTPPVADMQTALDTATAAVERVISTPFGSAR